MFIAWNEVIIQNLTIQNLLILNYHLYQLKYFMALYPDELYFVCGYKLMLIQLVLYILMIVIHLNVFAGIHSSCTCIIILFKQIKGQNKLKNHLQNDCIIL